MRVNISD